MAFFEVIIPIIVYSAIIGLTFVGAKFLIRGIKNRIASRQVNKELKQEAKKQKNLDKQNRKAIIKNKEKAPRYNLARGVNCIHTAENYNMIYKKGKYAKLKSKQNVLYEMLEDDNIKNKNQIAKKLQKVNHKLTLTTKMPEHKRQVEPDYVKEIITESGNICQDKRTYIQCFDEILANEFKKIAETEKETTQNKPAVAQINFNKKSKLAPLIVSSVSQKTFEEGYSLIAKKMLETIEEPENENAFPIKISLIIPGNNKINSKFKTLNNKNELNSYFKAEDITEKSMEK